VRELLPPPLVPVEGGECQEELGQGTAARAPASLARTTQPSPNDPVFTNSAFHPGETVIDVKEAPAPERPTSVPLLDTVVPLTADLRRVHYTVSKRFLDKLDRARDALSHSNPSASVEEILEKGLDLILDRSAKRKGLVAKPRKAKESLPPVRGSRYVPAEIRRAVWERDGGKCQFRLASGEICGSTYQVEIDHIESRALGGRATIDKLRCCCRPHNDEHARQVFGDGWMDRYTRRKRRRGERGTDAAGARSPSGSEAPPG